MAISACKCQLWIQCLVSNVIRDHIKCMQVIPTKHRLIKIQNLKENSDYLSYSTEILSLIVVTIGVGLLWHQDNYRQRETLLTFPILSRQV